MRSSRHATGVTVDPSTGALRPAVALSVPFLKQAAVGVAAAMLLTGGVGAVAVPTQTAADHVTVVSTVEMLPGRGELAEPISRSTTREPIADVPAVGALTPSAAHTTATSSPVASAPDPAPATTAAPTTRTLYTTVLVKVRAQASADSAVVTQLAAGTALTAVGDAAGGWQQVSRAAASGYIAAAYLTASAPAATSPATTAPKAPAASSGGYPACPSGSGVESGLTSRAITVHRAICASFPSITSFIGRRADGEHSDGRALDCMVSGATGRALAEWARANASALGIQTVIFEQKIWTQQRAAEGWRPMANRGSATANHYDHVHIQVY